MTVFVCLNVFVLANIVDFETKHEELFWELASMHLAMSAHL